MIKGTGDRLKFALHHSGFFYSHTVMSLVLKATDTSEFSHMTSLPLLFLQRFSRCKDRPPVLHLRKIRAIFSLSKMTQLAVSIVSTVVSCREQRGRKPCFDFLRDYDLIFSPGNFSTANTKHT